MSDPAIPGQGPRDPEQAEIDGGRAAAAIAPATRMGAVHLSVSDLARSVEYYTKQIGLAVREHARGGASLGTEERELLVLEEQPGVRPSSGFAGLYHFALLLPERADLARWIAHAARDGVRLTGASDHFVSEALYLNDPDLHGIEIYRDRPREHWEGQVASRMTSLPLDIEDILGELAGADPGPYAGMPAGTVMGHVHLRVADVGQTVAFYRDVVGLGLMAQLGAQAAFLSAGGYHHHLGANTWESRGAAQAPEGTARLLHYEIAVPDAAEAGRVRDRLVAAAHPLESGEGLRFRDPSGNLVLVREA